MQGTGVSALQVSWWLEVTKFQLPFPCSWQIPFLLTSQAVTTEPRTSGSLNSHWASQDLPHSQQRTGRHMLTLEFFGAMSWEASAQVRTFECPGLSATEWDAVPSHRAGAADCWGVPRRSHLPHFLKTKTENKTQKQTQSKKTEEIWWGNDSACSFHFRSEGKYSTFRSTKA